MDVTLMLGKTVSLLKKIAHPPQCHVEAIRHELVVKAFHCFLQGDDVPSPQYVFRFLFHAEVLVSIKNAESLLFGQSVGHVVVEVMIVLARWGVFSGWCLAERWIGTISHRHCDAQE